MFAKRANSIISQWSSASHYRPKKSVSFNPVVEYFYYDILETTPQELRRLDLENGQRGRLLPLRKQTFGFCPPRQRGNQEHTQEAPIIERGSSERGSSERDIYNRVKG